MKTLEMTAAQFQRIRERDLKLTRSEFAKIFGFTPRHVRNLENGKKYITQRNAMLMILAKKAHAKGLISFK